jgi:hypothetical protein
MRKVVFRSRNVSLDLDDNEIEFERLSQGLDVQAALAYAQHRATVLGLQSSKLLHLSVVGELAGKYVDVYYIDYDTLHRRYLRQACQSAGYLHETLLQGSTFEDLVTVVDESVAKLVSAVTPDVRLPHPERVQIFSNRIGLSEAAAQIVKLADLFHECCYRLEQVEVDQQAAKDFLTESSVTLSSLHKVHGSNLAGRITLLKEQMRELELRLKAIRTREKTDAVAFRERN